MEFLLKISRGKIEGNNIKTKRYLYDKIDLDNKLIAILGARGTGKTTLMLQLIKEKFEISETIYLSLDHIFFLENRLVNVIEDFYTRYGIKNFFLDEVINTEIGSRRLKISMIFTMILKLLSLEVQA